MIHRQGRRYKLCAYFAELHIIHHLYQLLVGLAVGRQFPFRVKQIGFDLVFLFRQHSGHGKGISAIVARSGKYRDGSCDVPAFGDGFGQCLCGPLHQVDRCNRFMFYGVSIQFLDAATWKNLHGELSF